MGAGCRVPTSPGFPAYSAYIHVCVFVLVVYLFMYTCVFICGCTPKVGIHIPFQIPQSRKFCNQNALLVDDSAQPNICVCVCG